MPAKHKKKSVAATPSDPAEDLQRLLTLLDIPCTPTLSADDAVKVIDIIAFGTPEKDKLAKLKGLLIQKGSVAFAVLVGAFQDQAMRQYIRDVVTSYGVFVSVLSGGSDEKTEKAEPEPSITTQTSITTEAPQDLHTMEAVSLETDISQPAPTTPQPSPTSAVDEKEGDGEVAQLKKKLRELEVEKMAISAQNRQLQTERDQFEAANKQLKKENSGLQRKLDKQKTIVQAQQLRLLLEKAQKLWNVFPADLSPLARTFLTPGNAMYDQLSRVIHQDFKPDLCAEAIRAHPQTALFEELFNYVKTPLGKT